MGAFEVVFHKNDMGEFTGDHEKYPDSWIIVVHLANGETIPLAYLGLGCRTKEKAEETMKQLTDAIGKMAEKGRSKWKR